MSHKTILRLFLTLGIILLSMAYTLTYSQAELNWGTTYTISVHTDGSAEWAYERKTLLRTENDILEWWNETFDEKRLAYEDHFESIVNETQQTTGRNMSITHVNAIYQRTETEGIIKYQFDWFGFAEFEDKAIHIGDAFRTKFIDLNQDALLIIQYPEGYTFTETKPQPMGVSIHDRTLSWKGPMNFDYDEPKVTLIQGTAQYFNPWQAYIPIAVGAGSISALSIALWFFLYGKRTKVGNVTRVPTLGIEDDDQKVTALLQRAGGSILQSSITKEFGFSKAKTSQLLDAMEKKGTVTRQKKGREKIVTLRARIQPTQRKKE